MRRHVKASSAASAQAMDNRRVRIALACLMVVGLVAFLGIGAPSASAFDTCPNAVFRTGPSANLPDCRAYELVTPSYTGGLVPTFEGFLADLPGMFATDTVTPAGDSVVYNTLGGGLTGFPATGYVDRYRAKRTAEGWVTEPTSPGGDEMSQGGPGGVSPDHEYSVGSAGDPTAKLSPAFAGTNVVDLLRTPSGYEPLGRGSLGDLVEGARADAKWISDGGTHVIFGAKVKLEPNAPPTGLETVYDRRPGGPTHVVSLLPGNKTPNENSNYLGATKDGTEIAFNLDDEGNSNPIYARRNNAITEEVVRPTGVVVDKELKCSGAPEGATLEYHWLRNGATIGGATGTSYTTTAADKGSVVQCRVTASNAEGVAVATSATRVVEPYQEGTNPPETSGSAHVNGGVTSAAVGTLLTCDANFQASPTITYQWLADGTEIPGAGDSTYTPVEADAGGSLQCRVTAANADGTALAYSANPISIYSPVPHPADGPEILNISDPDATPQAGDQLFCAHHKWSQNPGFSYQWLRNGAPIGGASSAGYTTQGTDEEKVLQCLVTAATSGGSTQAVTNAATVDPQPSIAPPVQTFPGGVFGTPQVGGELFCGGGGWEGEPSFSYQWLRNGTKIVGATSNSYTLSPADLEAVVQCRLTASNTGGAAVAINANEGAKTITRAVPAADASLPQPGLAFNGIFGGRVFYSDAFTYFGAEQVSNFGDLYMYDLNEEKTTRITSSGDAVFVNVSEDGSHVYFISRSTIDGEGTVGAPNLGVYFVSDKKKKFIGTVNEADIAAGNAGFNQSAGLNTWGLALFAGVSLDRGRAMTHTRSTPDGTVFAFETTAQLTSFNNTEKNPEDCGKVEIGGQHCDEVYRYDADNEELTCVSCGPGTGPATGNARLQSINTDGGVSGVAPATPNSPVESLTVDGGTVFFESTEGLVPQDGNETKDVYRWTNGSGVALISSGQVARESALYSVTPSGSDVIFGTREKLLPQDENGSTVRLYDARVNGGFPPPEETVTEPCAGDTCQGATTGAPEAPNVASSSLNGASGNVAPKRRCGRHSRRVVRKGSERCVHRHYRRGHHSRRAAR